MWRWRLIGLCATALLALAARAGEEAPPVGGTEPAEASGANAAAAPAAATAPDLGPVLGKAIRVAVYELKGREVPERITRIATNSLVAELRKLERVAAIGMDEIRDMLTHEENKRMVGCDDESCLAEIAGAMGVDELVTGSLARLGDASVINLRRLDLRKAEAAGSFNQRLTIGEGEEFLAAIGPGVEILYPGYPLRPGVERGVPEEVGLSLDPPPLPTWIFWTTASTAAGFGLMGSSAALVSKNKYDAANAYGRSGGRLDNAVFREKQDEALAWDNAKLGLLITFGILAAAAGLEAIWTDWHGYREAGLKLGAGPTVGGDYAGVTVSGGGVSW